MLRTCISKTEYEAMKTWRKLHGNHDCNNTLTYPQISIFDLLEVWENEKGKLFHLLGDNLTISKQINYEKPFEQMEKEMSVLLFDSVFYRNLMSSAAYPSLRTLMSSKLLVNNKWDNESFEITLPNNKIYKVQKGTKIMKILGKLASAYNLEDFEDFRNQHSIILNDKKITGTLTLSIHPLDFWTMSDNNNDWRSCMNWSDVGCYRSGTIEMMNSPIIIEAYVSNNSSFDLGEGFTWNNKLWRQLFIVTEDMIFGIKGYPYQSEFLTKEILKWIAELAKKNLKWDYLSETFCYNFKNKTFSSDYCQIDASKVVFQTEHMYNDVSSIAHYCLLRSKDMFRDKYVVNYSGPMQCLCCGDTGIMLESEACLCCDDCETIPRCEICEDVILSCDNLVEIGSHVYCNECFNECITICSRCDEAVPREDAQCFYLILSAEGDVYKAPSVLCPDCFFYAKNKIQFYTDGDDLYAFYEECRDKAPDLLPYELRKCKSLIYFKSLYQPSIRREDIDTFKKI